MSSGKQTTLTIDGVKVCGVQDTSKRCIRVDALWRSADIDTTNQLVKSQVVTGRWAS